MSSSKVKLAREYLAHWHKCLEWLAAQPCGAEIELFTSARRPEINTEGRRARAMRESVKTQPGWGLAVRAMVEGNELGFAIRQQGFGVFRLFAVRRSPHRTLTQILASHGQDIAKTD